MTFDPQVFITNNHSEFEDVPEAISWITMEQASGAEAQRNRLLDALKNSPESGAGMLFEDTKPYLRDISPGCRLCGEGKWSCLFINNICNARCFYCPDQQTELGQPVTNTLTFDEPDSFADYIRTFGIQGVSFSGGEPLLSFDRVTRFLKTLRKAISHPLHIWMYTNGILATPDRLKQLRDLGLDEIRFDLSAVDYNMESVSRAVGIIPIVTVEIPAIPEDVDRMKQVMTSLWNSGVNYLNLHQLRCTPHNATAFAKRGYTFVHGPKPTVLETELSALSLMVHAVNEKIGLPVNYCSYIYRFQYQAAGARKRSAELIRKPYEDITATGHIRTLEYSATDQVLTETLKRLVESGISQDSWFIDRKAGKLFLNSRAWPLVNRESGMMTVSYAHAFLRQQVTYRNPFKEVRLPSGKTIVVEKTTVAKKLAVDDRIASTLDCLSASNATGTAVIQNPPLPVDWGDAAPWEAFRPGLSDYY